MKQQLNLFQKNNAPSRGFIFSLSALLIVSLMVLFAFSLLTFFNQTSAQSVEAHLMQRNAFIQNDLSKDVSLILGTKIHSYASSNSVVLNLRDRLPGDVNKSKLLDWKQFVDQNYASRNNVSMNADVSSAADGQTELFLGNDLEYRYAYSNKSQTQLFSPTNQTIQRMDLNILVNQSAISSTAWAWNPSGDLNVTLRYSDGNASNSINTSGFLDSTIVNQYSFQYSVNPSDVMVIKIGPMGAFNKTLRIDANFLTSTTRADTDLNIWLPLSASISPSRHNLNIDLLQGDWNASFNPFVVNP